MSNVRVNRSSDLRRYIRRINRRLCAGREGIRAHADILRAQSAEGRRARVISKSEMKSRDSRRREDRPILYTGLNANYLIGRRETRRTLAPFIHVPNVSVVRCAVRTETRLSKHEQRSAPAPTPYRQKPISRLLS